MKRNIFAVFAAGLLCAAVALGGCGTVTNAIDCNTICDRYKTCYDKTYDTGACETRCKNSSNSDSNYMQKSQTCSACLDNNKDCASTTFNCTSQCSGIVP